MANLSAALIVNNLFDLDEKAPSNTSLPNDIPLPGQQVLLELSYQF